MGFIYAAKCKINGKIYVGQTSGTIERRWRAHIFDARHGDSQPKLNRAIRKYGEDSFEVVCLEEIQNAKLNEREIFWIAKLDTYCNGYNCTFGGEGRAKYNNDFILNMWDSGFSITEIKNTVGCNRHHVYEVLQGYEGYSKEKSRLRCKNNKRPICQYTLDGEYIQTFKSIAEAAKIFNVSSTTLSAACRNKIPSAAGFQWRYANDDVPEKYIDNQRKRKPVKQYSYDRRLIKIYDSFIAAYRATGISAASISLCCQGKQNSAGGYMWSYVNDNPPEKYNSHRKIVNQYSKDGCFIRSFPMIKTASEQTGISQNNIQSCCAGRSKTAGGFLWEYAEV